MVKQNKVQIFAFKTYVSDADFDTVSIILVSSYFLYIVPIYSFVTFITFFNRNYKVLKTQFWDLEGKKHNS